MSFLKQQIGIDLGSSHTRVFIPGKGIVFRAPTLVACDVHHHSVVAYGEEAASFVGRAPKGIEVSLPIQHSIIADYETTEAFLGYILDTVLPKWQFFKPDILFGIPSHITSTARKALLEATLRAGASHVFFVKNPLLGALGAGISVHEAGGCMIVDVGGGTVDIAILSLGGIVSSLTISSGGNALDKSITDSIRKRHGIIVGQKTAETLKLSLGSAYTDKDEEREITGNDIVSGLPKIVMINSKDIFTAIEPHLEKVIQGIKDVLHNTPPELASDIMDKGLTLVGGGAQLPGLADYIYRETKVPVTLNSKPKEAVIQGIGKALEHLDVYKRWLVR